MFLAPFLFVLVSLVITLLAPSPRVATGISVAASVAAWVLIAAFAYNSPIPPNEPEWWGGLAIVCGLAGIGLTIGGLLRRRQTRSLSDRSGGT